MAKDYLEYNVPDGTDKIRIRYNAETEKLEAEMIPKEETDPPPVTPPPPDGVTVTDHVVSFLTGKGKGAFANSEED